VRISWLFVVAACSSTKQPPAQPTPATQPIAHSTRSCSDAALGLENATKGVRAPERSVYEQLRLRCLEDRWPASVVECFATMAEGDLGKCSRTMTDAQREPMFAVLAGTESSRAGIYVTRARLEQLQVGVPECDRFVTAVATMLTCEQLELDTRLQLGKETAEFWSLPTNRLSREDMLRISEVCGQSLASLERQALDVGCML
jgi:hypothetical protein